MSGDNSPPSGVRVYLVSAVLGLISLRSNSGFTTPPSPVPTAHQSGIAPYWVSAVWGLISSRSNSNFTIPPCPAIAAHLSAVRLVMGTIMLGHKILVCSSMIMPITRFGQICCPQCWDLYPLAPIATLLLPNAPFLRPIRAVFGCLSCPQCWDQYPCVLIVTLLSPHILFLQHTVFPSVQSVRL